jgi:ATP-dependent Clp protease protease subunit
MQLVRQDVSTICVGQAASMAAFLLAGGARGKRYALPNSRVLLHQPMGGSQGQATDVEIQARELVRIKQLMVDIMASDMEQTKEKIARDIDRDYILTPIEAVEYGVVDSVIQKRDL